MKAFGDEYTAKIPALFEKLCEGPLVLSHGDWRLDNLFFTPDGEVVAVDWQLIDRSVGPRDLAYLVTESINVADPSDYQAAFATYLGDLAAHDVHPDEAWAYEMYRYGTMLGFVYPVVAAGALTIDDPRHLELTGADAPARHRRVGITRRLRSGVVATRRAASRCSRASASSTCACPCGPVRCGARFETTCVCDVSQLSVTRVPPSTGSSS